MNKEEIIKKLKEHNINILNPNDFSINELKNILKEKKKWN